jgi:hypothetical protein
MKLEPAHDNIHKYKAVFNDGTSTKFGATGYGDYIHYHRESPEKAEMKKAAYIARHSVNENFNSARTAGALSRFLLWNKSSLPASLADYRRRFPGV